MKFHAQTVDASAAGDYYQVYFGPEESEEEAADPFNLKGPYLLIQRQFEMYDGGRCGIESDDENFLGHFHLRLTTLGPSRLSFAIKRERNNIVSISFSLSPLEFRKVRRITEVIFGLRDPTDEDSEL